MTIYFISILAIITLSILAVLYVRIFRQGDTVEDNRPDGPGVDNFTLLE
jgi:uncharacterized membrane protein